MKQNKFNMGTIYCTRGVHETMKKDAEFALMVHASVARYAECDWGDISDSDTILNNDAVLNKDENARILASYSTNRGKIWIITESLRHPDGPRTITTVLFPDEY